jgi:RHS repeat-associated protein
MAPDGNLYIYNWAAGVGTWGPGTQGHSGAYARLETDGNFVVYTSTGVALWSSGTSGTNAERLDMEDDGRIIIYKSAWNSGTSTGQFNYTTLAHPGCDAGIGTGTTGMLGTGQCFVSPNGHFELLLQSDGNLVIYDLGVTPATARWSTNTSISPVDPGYSMRTLYSYDTLGNLLRVEQHGGTTDSTQWRVRTFTYNSFSQLLTATNPESGTISYTYDAEGKLLMKTSPAPNILPPSTATQTVSYCYDELHRVTKRDYQPHTYNPPACPITAPVVSYVYDSGTNANGQLVSMTDQAGTATYAYDVLGRMTTETRPIAGVTKSIGYGYNLNGSIKTLTYPSGRVVTYTPDTAGQLITAADGNGTQYVTNATYYASGAEYQRYMPGIYFRTDLNPRLQVSGFYSDNSQTNSFFMNKTYSFGAVHQNNGNVMSITNNKDSNRTQTFTYDGLNRITAGWSSANSGAMSWGENYAIDAWGNLQMTPMAGKAHGGNFTLSATVKNQPTGLGYDVAGNLLTYGTASYLYDLENRMLSTAGMSYTYDGNGERVLKSQTVGGAAVKRYWSMGGNALAEADGSGNLTAEYIYFGGQRVARIDLPAGSVHYYLSDHLKSTSMVVSAAGAIEEDSDYSSFGTEYPIIGAGLNRYKFTGKERDPESGLDYFGARYYSNGLGRFISADWSATPIPVPYADFGDPQSLNQYSYVRNIPTVKVDADGHEGGYTYNANGSMTAPTEATTDGHPIRDTIALGVGTAVSLALPGAGTLVQNLFGIGLATAPVTVPIAADIIEGATPGAPGPKLPAASTLGKAEQLIVNKATGKAFEKTVVDATKATDAKVAEQLTLKTESGAKTRMDVVSTNGSGQVRLQEAKGSATAPLTPNQTVAHPEIAQTGATVVGQGKPGYPGGTQIPPTKVEVVRPGQN